jgi:hypothetical protein
MFYYLPVGRAEEAAGVGVKGTVGDESLAVTRASAKRASFPAVSRYRCQQTRTHTRVRYCQSSAELTATATSGGPSSLFSEAEGKGVLK